MDKRTKILAGVFGLMIAGAFVSKVLYPSWIKPRLTINERVEERKEYLAKLEEQAQRLDKAKYEYREWAGRTGSFDMSAAITEIRDRLNSLLEKHKLSDVKVTPTRPSEDRKTGLMSATVTVAATGSLDEIVLFMRDVSELPHLCRIGNASIDPAGSSRRNATVNNYNVRVPLEIIAVPQHPMVGKLKPDQLVHEEFFIRHTGRDYADIWKDDPFNEYVPMRVTTKPGVTIEKGQRANLEVDVVGGITPYRYEWTPDTGISAADIARPVLDSSEVRTERYTVTVTDARGNTGNSVMAVTIKEPPPPPVETVVEKQPVRPQPPPVRNRQISRDAQMMRLTMFLREESDGERTEEIVVTRNGTDANTYYAVGDDFEGGKLVFANTTGAVVNWEDDYFIYPLGEDLRGFVEAPQATDYPDLQEVVRKHAALTKKESEAKEAANKKEAAATTTEDSTDKTQRSANKPQSNTKVPNRTNPSARTAANRTKTPGASQRTINTNNAKSSRNQVPAKQPSQTNNSDRFKNQLNEVKRTRPPQKARPRDGG